MRKDFDNQQLSEQGFPYCPDCGGTLSWNGDFQASELGYVPEDTPLEDDPVINSLTCANEDCQKTFDIMFENGAYHLLCVSKMSEGDDEPEIEFTEFAIERFPVLKEELNIK